MAWITQSIGAIAGLAGTSAYIAAQNAYVPQRIHLEVAQVEYIEIDNLGYMRQKIVSASGDPVPAVWTVSITRVDDRGASHVLCSGSGGAESPGQYNGDVDTYTLDDWTGSTCQDSRLRKGDFAEATWTYKNEHGILVTIGTKIEVE